MLLPLPVSRACAQLRGLPREVYVGLFFVCAVAFACREGTLVTLIQALALAPAPAPANALRTAPTASVGLGLSARAAAAAAGSNTAAVAPAHPFSDLQDLSFRVDGHGRVVPPERGFARLWQNLILTDAIRMHHGSAGSAGSSGIHAHPPLPPLLDDVAFAVVTSDDRVSSWVPDIWKAWLHQAKSAVVFSTFKHVKWICSGHICTNTPVHAQIRVTCIDALCRLTNRYVCPALLCGTPQAIPSLYMRAQAIRK